MGVCSSDGFALAEAQMTHPEQFVTGPPTSSTLLVEFLGIT
jgi:hypothetical protein